MRLLSFMKIYKNPLTKVLTKLNSSRNYGTQKNTIRIGCASGFWGDTPTAAGQLVRHGKLDYLVLDYLSEVTMSLLVAVQQKNPEMGGWCPDFVQSVGPLLPEAKKQGIKIITNAGGVNPASCMKALMGVAQKMGVDNLKVALVTGDDLLHKKGELTLEQCPIPASVTSANAYLGAGPISRALELGADVVITGRCTDSALALGPLIHSYKWDMNDYDLMASGSLAGHLIECGAQATGGIYTDWETVSGWENNGFPIAVCEPDGNFCITKPSGTGGLVTRGTVSEQMLYEIGDPTAYILPDVVCDFSNVHLSELTEEGSDLVRVTGAKGRPPTVFHKVGGTFQDGWKCTAVCPIIGPKAREKGHKTAKAILKRSRALFKMTKMPDFIRTHVQILGSEEAYGANARKENLETRDAILWMGVQHSDKKALEMFAKEIASAGTGMAPGLTTVISGRPKATPLLRFFSYLYPKEELEVKIVTSDGHQEIYKNPPQSKTTNLEELGVDSEDYETNLKVKSGSHSYKLSELAWLRSGDKGDSCNIGVIARDPSYFPFIKNQLSSQLVAKYFEHKFIQDGNPIVRRYNVPGIHGLNFLLERSLGGGGIAALNPDPQGKGYAQMLADFTINNVPKLK